MTIIHNYIPSKSAFCTFISSTEDQEALFEEILLGQLDFPVPHWDYVSDTAKVCEVVYLQRGLCLT